MFNLRKTFQDCIDLLVIYTSVGTEFLKTFEICENELKLPADTYCPTQQVLLVWLFFVAWCGWLWLQLGRLAVFLVVLGFMKDFKIMFSRSMRSNKLIKRTQKKNSIHSYLHPMLPTLGFNVQEPKLCQVIKLYNRIFYRQLTFILQQRCHIQLSNFRKRNWTRIRINKLFCRQGGSCEKKKAV